MQKEYLASVLLQAEKEYESPLTDFFFSQSANPDPSASAVSSQVALRYLKKSLPHAVAIAGNREIDPEVLARFAKDPRVSVRHAALKNPSIPTESLLYLLKWLFRHTTSDQKALSVQIGRLSAEQLVELSEDVVSHRQFTGVTLSDENLRKVAFTLAASPEHLAKVRLEAFDVLDQKLAQLALSGSLHKVTLADVFEKAGASFGQPDDRSTARAAELVRGLIGTAGMLTHELLDLWDGSVSIRSPYYHRPAGPAALVEPGVLERLAEGPPQYLELAVVNRAPERLVAARIPSADMTVMVALSSTLGFDYLSPRSEQLLAQRLLEMGSDDRHARQRDEIIRLAAEMVTRAQSRLPEELLVGVLRLGGAKITSDWLAGRPVRFTAPGGEILERQCNQPVTASALRALGDEPGLALDRSRARYSRNLTAGEGWEMLINDLLVASTGSAEIGSVAVSLLGDNLTGRRLSFGNTALMLYPYLRSVIGEDRERWSAFLTLACDWESGLEDLIEASSLLVHS